MVQKLCAISKRKRGGGIKKVCSGNEFFETIEVAKMRLLSFAMSVCPSVCTNSRTDERIFIKFDTEEFHYNSLMHYNFGQNRTT
jgi:hypothetical protein